MQNSDLKDRAIELLKKNYWMLFLGSFIYQIIYALTNSVVRSLQRVGIDSNAAQRALERGYYSDYIRYSVNPVMSLTINLFSIAAAIFLTNIILVGLNKFFIKAATDNVFDIGLLFEPFKNYWSVFKTMGMRYLYISLWSLLLIIPGIVKSFSYWMIPYILAENPDIDTNRAFEISMKTMYGEKGKCFYMYLSFIGWEILGLALCCFGIYFVLPYQCATYQEFYQYVKAKALSCGIATPEDFGSSVQAN